MPTLAAARFNPDLKAKYAELVEAGKPQGEFVELPE